MAEAGAEAVQVVVAEHFRPFGSAGRDPLVFWRAAADGTRRMAAFFAVLLAALPGRCGRQVVAI